jgi:hypothetical protein
MSHSPARNSQLPLLLLVILAATACGKSPPKQADGADSVALVAAMKNVAAMKSNLRNLATYEEQYADDHNGAYFSGDGSAQGFTPSMDVTVAANAVVGPPPSWTATAVHSQSAKTCKARGSDFLVSAKHPVGSNSADVIVCT